jgi:cytochrome c-type biogenesis protein
MLAATRNSIGQAVGLGAAYSAGLGIPFLLAALGITWVTTILRKYGQVMRWTEIAMGILLVVIGVLMIFGIFSLINIFFQNTWTPPL